MGTTKTGPPLTAKGKSKAAPVRQQKACIVCRVAKMKCIGCDNPPCERCIRNKVDCVFLPSRRGKQKPRDTDSAGSLSADNVQDPVNGDIVLDFLHQREDSTMLDNNNNLSFFVDGDIPIPLATDTAVNGISTTSPDSQASGVPSFTQTYTGPVASTSCAMVPSNSICSQFPPSYNFVMPPIEWGRLSPAVLVESPASVPGAKRITFNTPLTILADVANTARPGPGEEGYKADGADKEIGIASLAFFDEVQEKRTPYNAFLKKAPIMKLISSEDVDELFKIFLSKLHVHSPAIDRDHCTPQLVANRSEVLFNCICCVSSRYYTQKPAVRTLLQKFAEKELAKFPTEKSLEAVQADLLYTGFGIVPPVTAQQDMLYLRIGMAMRMSLDLSLHQAGTPQYKHGSQPTLPWRISSMKRTWLLCNSLDKMMSCRMGVPAAVPDESPVASEDENMSPDDRRVAANVRIADIILRGMSATRKFAEESSPPNTEALTSAINFMEGEIEDWWDYWSLKINVGLPTTDVAIMQIRSARLKMYYYHAQLIAASMLLQLALDTEQTDPTLKPFALAKYQSAAISLLQTFGADFVAMDQARFLTDHQYGYLLYAAVALFKSIQPSFKHSLIAIPRAKKLLESTATAFENCAATPSHLPNLQAKFLRRIMQPRRASLQQSGSVCNNLELPVSTGQQLALGVDFGNLSGFQFPVPAQLPTALGSEAMPIFDDSWMNSSTLSLSTPTSTVAPDLPNGGSQGTPASAEGHRLDQIFLQGQTLDTPFEFGQTANQGFWSWNFDA